MDDHLGPLADGRLAYGGVGQVARHGAHPRIGGLPLGGHGDRRALVEQRPYEAASDEPRAPGHQRRSSPHGGPPRHPKPATLPQRPAKTGLSWMFCLIRVFEGKRGAHQYKRMGVGDMHVTGIVMAIIIGIVIGVLGRLVVPGRQNIPIWLTIVIGIVAALIGTAIAGALDVADTKGIDWIELLIQVLVAAVGVSLAAGLYGRRR